MTSAFEPLDDLQTSSEPQRRALTERQTELVGRLIDAAAMEVEERDYEQITVRTIAKRAGVAPATAYTYFSSKDHLLAEVLWRRMRDLPPVLVDLGTPAFERVGQVVAAMGFGTIDSPAFAAACTTALLATGPDVKAVRARIGGEIHRRLATAIGPEAPAEVLSVLEITYTGAMLSAGLGHLAFADIPQHLAQATRLLLGERS